MIKNLRRFESYSLQHRCIAKRLQHQTFNLLILGSNPNTSKTTMTLPLQLHFKELRFRTSYLLFSYLLSLLIMLKYNESIFFLETYALIYLDKKRFIATHITEVFFTSIYAGVSLSGAINFPYAYYHCRNFLVPSWYKSQVWFLSILVVPSSVLFFFCMFICYFSILPSFFHFLDNWKVALNYALEIQLEARIEIYTYWTLQTAYFLSNTTFIFFTKLLHSYLLDNMITLHVQARKFKKYFLVFLCLFTSFIVPPESFLQIVFVIVLASLVEVLFLVTCVFFAKNNV